MYTQKQKVEMAETHMKHHKISFGCREGDDTGIDLFIAGMLAVEKTYDETITQFKDTYMRLFKFHCDEYIKLAMRVENLKPATGESGEI